LRAVAQGDKPSPFRAGLRATTRYAGSDAAREALLSGQARPAALTTGDYDEDGVADLVVVYATHGGGVMVIWHGDEGALFPNGAEARKRRARSESPDSPFRVTATAFELAEAPDFVGAGDFDADGHFDVVTARAGGDALHIHKGDGRGGLSQTERLALSGNLTALAVGEVNRADGLADIVAGIVSTEGARAQLFGSPEGALRARAESVTLSGPARALALGQLDEDAAMDLAVASGNTVQIISGHTTPRSVESQKARAGARVSQHLFASEVRALAVGDFAGDARSDLAVLTGEGEVQVLWSEVGKKRRAAGDAAAQTSSAVSRRSDEAVRLSSTARLLFTARVASPKDALLALGGDGRQVQVVTDEATAQAGTEEQVATLPHLRVSTSLETGGGGAVAVLPMRLNGDAIDDLVMLTEGAGEPLMLMSTPAHVFAVNSAGDGADSNPADDICDDGTSNCTLRAAIQQANASAGADFIGFDLPPAPVNTISPASPLPNITESVTIDGLTQVDGIVVLNGSAAPAGTDGLRVSGGGTRITTLVINGFADDGVELLSGNNIIDGNSIGTDASFSAPGPGNGGDGVSIFAVSGNLVGGTTAAARNVISANLRGVLINGAPASNNLVQGNFIGTDLSGTAALGNTRGVNLNGGTNNVVGGTAPGARNVISGNTFSGVRMVSAASFCLVQGNLIGTTANGLAPLGNAEHGVEFSNATNITVGGAAPGARNVISGNGLNGVNVGGNTDGTQVQGNYIGTDASGNVALGNNGNGVNVGDPTGFFYNTLVGGAGAGNVISGNGGWGVRLTGVDTNSAQVQGNFIGTNASGSVAVGNQLGGVLVTNNASGNTVGGTDAAARNVISGNSGSGLLIDNGAHDNSLQGNFIGTDASGAADLGNAQNGVNLQDAPNNNVGGTDPAARNVISANGQMGLYIGSASGNVVQGNYVGTNAAGSAALGNGGDGVHLNNASNNTVGGLTAGAGNVISGNAQHGVHLFLGSSGNFVYGNSIGTDAAGNAALGNNTGVLIDGGGTGNELRRNSIFANNGLGIDLSGEGVTPNDAGDADAGPNNLQNFPLLSNATPSGGTTVVNGTLNSTAGSVFNVEFFANTSCDPSGNGEGQTYLGEIPLTTDGGGNVGFSFNTPAPVPLGRFITATATGPGGNTSEFSPCRQVISPNYVVNSTGDGADSNLGDFACNDGSGNCTLRAAIQQSNSDGQPSTITFAPGLAGQTIQPASPLTSLEEGGTTLNGDLNNDCVPDIELDGSLVSNHGIRIASANNIVRGLLVNNFGQNGIHLPGTISTGNTVTCNYIGTDLTGTQNRGNQTGVGAGFGAHDNQIGPNNRIAFNDGVGVEVGDGAILAYPTFTSLTPDFTGQFSPINFPGTSGAFRHTSGFTPLDGANRPFVDNFGARFTGTLNVTTSGNYTFTLTNPDDQVRIVVDGNEILSVNCCSNASTTVNLSATGHPIEVDYFDGPGAARLTLDLTGPGPVNFTNGPQPGLLGEFFQLRVPSERNRITHNSIYQNGSIGINLDALEGNFGVNLNDPNDGDVGPNTALNHPVINRVNAGGGGSFTVQGSSPPNATVELFLTTNDDPSGFGEGREFITSVASAPTFDGLFSATFNAPPGFTHVTATATDSQGNTSEFARNVALAQSRWGNSFIFSGAGIPNISGPIGYVTGDLNGDGRLDLIAAGQHNTPPHPCRLFVELQDGSGQFPTVNQEPMGAGEGLCNNTQESLAIGDLDADGDLDFVAQGTDNTSTGRLLLFKNDGAGTFTQQPDILSPGIVNGAVALGDINGDGRLDLAVSGHDNVTSRFVIFTNDGSGVFSVSQQPLGTADGLAHGSIAFNDREKDGDLDLVVSGQNNSGVNRLSSLTNNGGTLTVTLEILPSGFTPRAKQLRFADLDLDGDLDLLWTAVLNAGSATESQLYRTTNSGGSYASGPPQLIHTELSGGGPPAGLAVGDANGDGFPDAFMVGTFSSLTYFQGGPGGLTLAEQPPVHFTGPVIFGDFDGDNDLDLATLPPNDGLYVNQLGPANAAPSAPTGLNVVVGTPNTELRWSNSADAETPFVSLNYEVRLGTASGVYNLISGVYGTPLLGTQPLSRVATTVAGRRLALGPGTYFWQVRAIDTGLRASAWSAENSFSIQPSLSINNVSVVEGNAGTTTANFTVTLTNGGGPVSVDFATSNGAAFAGSDYVATSGTLNLSSATPTQPVSVTVNGDTLGEPNENFFVNLSNASGAVINVSRGQATILNDEPAPTVSVGDSSTPEGDAGTRSALFTVYLSSATHQNVTVNFDVADGTANAGSDYVDAAGPVTIPAGQTSATVAVTLNGDTTPEPDETFFVNLSSPANAAPGDMQGAGTIKDDENDPPPASLAATWTPAQEGIAGINAAASNGSLYVVAGNSGDIWTSPDTVNWTKRTNPDSTSRGIQGMTFGGGQFVAVGQAPTADGGTLVLTSPDGVTWTQRSTAPLQRNLRGVAFGGGVYVAASNNGRVMTSPDGVTWTERQTGNLQRLNGVAFGGGLFVAVGDNRTVITSADGINWTVRGGIPAGLPRQLNSVTHTGTQFVVISQDPSGANGSGAGVMTSPDGVTWTQRSVPTTQPLTGVASGGGVIVAVGIAADANGTFLSSTDGMTWTARAANEPGPGVARSFGRAVTYGTAGFIAATSRGTVYASTDGTTNWQSRTLATSRTLSSVAHNGSTFCAVGVNGAIYSSPDGATWTAQSGPDYIAYFFWGSVKYAGGQFVAVGLSDSVMTSPDCVNWTVRNPAAPLVPFAPANGSLEDVAYGGGLFVAVGDIVISPTQTEVRILTSPDGINWTPRSSGVPPTFIQGYSAGAVAYGNGTFVAHFTDSVTGEFIIITSPDGVTWTRQPTPNFDRINFEGFGDIVYAGGMFVGVGDRIWTSPDGATWTLRLDYTDTFFLGAAHDGGRFVAVGFNGGIYASSDGIDWSPQTSATRHTLNGVVAGGTRFVAVGESAIEYADFGPLNFVVNSAADTDDGACDAADCTLREAINASNAQGGVNTIAFHIPGAGVHTIAPTSELPTVTDPVVIDGTTQPGFAGTPLIELNGAGAGVASDGLTVASGGSTVRGLVINRFDGSGIRLQTGGGNVVTGNYIGTDAAGAADLGNSSSGVMVDNSPNNIVGGLTPAARNLLSGNNQYGVCINGAASTGNQVQGNFVGTDATGTTDVGNTLDGINVLGAPNNTVGGTAAGAGNLVSGNDRHGVSLSGATGTTVRGNFIGTNAAVAARLKNTSDGVFLSGGNGNTIGGSLAGSANVISGNGLHGVEFSASSNNTVQGNFIGTNAAGSSSLFNEGRGVYIQGGASNNNAIGGTAAGQGNTIAFNLMQGVYVGSGVGNAIRGNSIHSNTLLGIDLGAVGVTANDSKDKDTGANNLQNFPVISSASAGTQRVMGSFSSLVQTQFTIQFFSSPTCDASGNGEGVTPIGTTTVTTANNGNASFNVVVPLVAGQRVTATATDPAGNTSEFSPCFTVGP
jgi:CSLREA domain-containing protein